jgi:hypothetical protein
MDKEEALKIAETYAEIVAKELGMSQNLCKLTSGC